jgi:hypothetical protein
MKGQAGSAVLLVALVACGGERPRPPSAEPALGSAVARVADVTIPATLVESVVAAGGAPARSALDGLVQDALAARGALDQHLDGEPQVAFASDVALARRIPLRAMADARTAGPPTPDELQLVTVVHAVVARSTSLTEDNALLVANNVERAVAGSRTAQDFEARVQALPWQHARVIAQTVGPFGIDGRDPRGSVIDTAFVAAAFALRSPLQISRVVATAFGWHVIQLLSREPSREAPPERSEALASAAVEVRARIHLAEVLQLRRERAPVEISHDAESLMALATGAAP